MRQNFLISSRHRSIYYFRRRIPADLQGMICKTYIVKTMATASKAAAIVLARAYAAKTDALYARLRLTEKSKLNDIRFGYTFDFSLDDQSNPTSK